MAWRKVFWICIYQSVNAILSDVIAMYETDGHLDKCLKCCNFWKFITFSMSTLIDPIWLCYYSEMRVILSYSEVAWRVFDWLMNCGMLKILHCCTCFQHGAFDNVFANVIPRLYRGYYLYSWWLQSVKH